MSVLRNANFRRLFIGQLVSTYGNNLYVLALPWYIYSITNSKLDLTVVGFADYVPALAGLFLGVLVDRWRKQRVMLWSDVIRMLLAFTICLVVALHGGFLAIFVLALLIQFIGSFFSPASGAFTPLLVPKEDLPQAMGLNQSGNGIVRMLSMVSGGVLMTSIKASMMFFIDGVTFAVSVVSIVLIRVSEDIPIHARRRNYGQDWKQGFRSLIRSQRILQIFLGGTIANFGLAPAIIVLTTWVKGPMHGTSTTYGLTTGAMILGTIFGGVFLGKLTKIISAKYILQYGLMLLGSCLGLIAVWADPYWCMMLLLLSGFAISSLNGALDVLLVNLVPQTMRGRIFGIFNAIMVTASPLGLAVFGGLMVAVPLWTIWVIIGGLSVLASMTYFLPVRDDLHTLSTLDTESF